MRLFAVLGALILSGFVAGQAVAAPADRDGDPVVVKGSVVPGMNGIQPDQIVGFKRFGDKWMQVPVQVDERKVVSVGTLYPSDPMPPYVINNDLTFDLEVYADEKTRVGPDNDPKLDGNDEIAFMSEDTGGEAPAGTVAPDGVLPGGKVSEVTVTDPVDSGKSYYYLFQSDGSLDPSAAASYVDYNFRLTEFGPGDTLIDDYGFSNASNPEDSEVSTPFYTLHSTGRWFEDGMEITAGDANGTDILDREVAQHTLSGCGRSEVTFSGNWTTAQRGGDQDEGTYLTVTNGPVRAIRSYMGANSGPYVQREHKYYEQREDNDIYLRVHPMNDLYAWTDYSPGAAGMTYRNFKNPAGVPVDGEPDVLTPATTADFAPGSVAWEQLVGPQGSVSTMTSVDTTIDPPDFGSRYLDDSTPTGPDEVQCGGDGKSYGASGFGIGVQNKLTPNTDPRLGNQKDLTVHRTRYFGDPGTDGEEVAKLAGRVKDPLIATATGFLLSSGKAKLKLRLPKRTLKVKAGRKASFKVRIKNTGDTGSKSVKVCARGPKVPKRCAGTKKVGAGKSRTRKMKIRVKRSARKGKLLKVRIVVRAKGTRTVRGKVRIRVK